MQKESFIVAKEVRKQLAAHEDEIDTTWMNLRMEYKHIYEFLTLKIDECNKRIHESESIQD